MQYFYEAFLGFDTIFIMALATKIMEVMPPKQYNWRGHH
jgi:hypothetical protein